MSLDQHRLAVSHGVGAGRCGLSLAFALVLLGRLVIGTAEAQVPALINYQGRIAVGRDDFEGQGRFKLALVNSDGSQVYWRNSPDSDSDGVPDSPVVLPVSRGLFSVQLGDSAVANMSPVTLGVFNNSAVFNGWRPTSEWPRWAMP